MGTSYFFLGSGPHGNQRQSYRPSAPLRAGGGFAGTVQAFVPLDMVDSFKEGMERVLGEENCHVLSIRSEGGIREK